MSSNNLWFNMVASAVLATGLGILGLKTVGEMVYEGDKEAVGYPVEVAEAGEGGGAAAAELAPDWGTVLADPAQSATLIAQGEKNVKVCASCHAFEAGGANKTGPAMYGVFNRTAGTHAGFAYSEAMKGYGKAWDYDGLYNFLKAPKSYIKGTAMSYAGMSKQSDRIAMVAYLRSLAPSPAALPAPDPTRDPAKAAEAAAAGGAPAAAGATPEAAPSAAAPAAGATAPAAAGAAAAPTNAVVAPAAGAPAAAAAAAGAATNAVAPPAAPK